jgi:hypothetical protein
MVSFIVFLPIKIGITNIYFPEISTCAHPAVAQIKPIGNKPGRIAYTSQRFELKLPQAEIKPL